MSINENELYMDFEKYVEVCNDKPNWNITFVCVGNINRSPACEIILKHKIKGTSLSNWTVTSAALSEKNEGKKTTKKMRDSLEEAGFKYEEIRSKPLTKEMADKSTVIYIMDKANYNKIVQKFGNDILRKTRFIGDFGRDKYASSYISDPNFAKGIEEHKKVVAQLDYCIQKLVDNFK